MTLPASRTVVADRSVPDLAGRSCRSVVQVAVDEERATDTGAHRDEEEMARAASGACFQLRLTGSSRVMTQDHGTADSLRQHRGGGNLVPPDHVRGVVDDPRAWIDRTREAHCKSPDVRGPRGLTGALRNRIEYRRGTVLRGRIADHGFTVGDVTDRDRCADAGAPQVDADDRCAHAAG